MPIAVRVVSEDDFKKWLAEAKTKFASAAPAPAETASIRRLASADDYTNAAAAPAAH
jgi:heme/copper-type cytochrome/quinol oxidase subunit 2